MPSSFLIRYAPEIALRTGEHLVLVATAMAGAIAAGIPLGILIARQPQWARLVLVVANTVQTVPSLALFGFLITVPLLGGIGKVPAIVALTLYALLPLIRNTYTGIAGIDRGIREAAQALGLTPWQVLVGIDLPLALPAILAGVRVATIICVGVATIAAAIGGGGLGSFIFRGIATVNNALILAGAVPAAIMALMADWGLGWLEKHPIRRQAPPRRSPPSRRRVLLGCLLAGFLAFSAAAILHRQLASTSPGAPEIAIGSKNFTESVILGEILAQQIEAHTDLKVDRRFDLGGTFICHEAVRAGQLAGYVEYTGTAFTAILQRQPLSDPAAVYEQVKATYARQFQLAVLPPLGFENTFAILIRQEDADRLNLQTISDVVPHASQWKAGFGYEFLEREDGYPGLAKTYGLQFSQTPQAMDLGLTYRALAEKQVDLVAGNSTEGSIPVLALTILKDDKQYFPPYEAVPIFNQQILAQHPPLREAVEQLSGHISTPQMQQLNYAVDGAGKAVKDVARSFLQSEGLLPEGDVEK